MGKTNKTFHLSHLKNASAQSQHIHYNKEQKVLHGMNINKEEINYSS